MACILHAGAKNAYGYGKRKVNGKEYGAHRLAYANHIGVHVDDLPSTLIVRHTCDVPACINPAHLVAGTQADNMRDKVDRNRVSRPKGTGNGRAVLTEADVLALRKAYADGEATHSLASRFGIGIRNTQTIITRKSWTHI